ncbi:unnamed protein product [Callosobruchus maculatus]|uniref:Uncharacterized protein n=1 Tax=Callosobruchus maculatus TaxID=64391 RepID=A0A653DIC8_CALMS|nr:unnamed protein product [Callosobruchus maculatus]
MVEFHQNDMRHICSESICAELQHWIKVHNFCKLN